MNNLIAIFSEIEKSTSLEKGDYTLFALFLRDGAAEKWDVMVSADWITNDKKEAFKYLANKLQSSLNPVDLLSVSRIVIVDDGNLELHAIQMMVKVEHGKVEIKDSNIWGLQIKHAIIITSVRREEVVH